MIRSVMQVRSSSPPLQGVFTFGPATIHLSSDFIQIITHFYKAEQSVNPCAVRAFQWIMQDHNNKLFDCIQIKLFRLSREPQINNSFMYRQSNERFNQASNVSTMNPYVSAPHLQSQKLHMQTYNPILPPMFNDSSQTVNNYQYPPNYPLPPFGQSYDRSFDAVGWRQMSQPKGPMMPVNLGPSLNLHSVGNINIPPIHYDVRAMPSKNEFQPLKLQNQTYIGVGGQVGPQMNILQRLSGIIKSQLVGLQGIMSYADKKTQQQLQKKERQRSRSRSRQSRERSVRCPEGKKYHREWNCSKCSFLNFDFRDCCKRCKQPKPASSVADRYEDRVGNNYLPGPNDWKCLKCKNINYARRTSCHRCHIPRGK